MRVSNTILCALSIRAERTLIMETIRKPRFGFWHGVLAVILLIIIAALIFPIFFRARSTGRSSLSRHMAAEPTLRAMRSKSVDSDESPSWTTVSASTLPRMVISTADISVEVKDVKSASTTIIETVRAAGGFVTSSSISGESGSRTASITVRVPARSYQSSLQKLSTLGKVLSCEEKGEDVTEEFVDLGSRLRNLKREEQAILGVLTKANRVTDILAVERELNRIRGEIEQAEGRSKYLANQVSLATINISLNEPEPAVTNAVVWNLGETAKRSAHSLGVVFRMIISVAVWALVFVPLWALIWLTGIVIKRFRLRSKS